MHALRLAVMTAIAPLAAALATGGTAAAQADAPSAAKDRVAAAGAPRSARGRLFERVVATLGRNFHDRRFREGPLLELAARYREAAFGAGTRDEERAVIHALLAEIPASHLALYSRATQERLEGELFGQARPGVGFSVVQVGGAFWADAVLDGGPAAEAGIRRGDRVLALDGEAPGRSARLDWRADDAWLPDPAVHDVLARAGETVVVRVADADGRQRDVELAARRHSAWAASAASRRTFERDGARIGYLHLWFVFHGRSATLVRDAGDAFADHDGFVLDLRGRGGSALECAAVVRELERLRDDGLRLAFVVDARTRSAKEVLASQIRERRLGTLVGERTAGAVVPATFEPVGDDSVLMYPAYRLGKYSEQIEGKGVVPDVPAEDRFEFAGGEDPILDAALRHVADEISAARRWQPARRGR